MILHIGSTVKIEDHGEIYSSYEEKAIETGIIHFWKFGRSPRISPIIYKVSGLCLHEDGRRILVGIYNSAYQESYVIGIEGLVLTKPEQFEFQF